MKAGITKVFWSNTLTKILVNPGLFVINYLGANKRFTKMSYSKKKSAHRKTILLVSDHLLVHSGVGIQSKLLAEGLVKLGKWRVVQIAAMPNVPKVEIIEYGEYIKLYQTHDFGDMSQFKRISNIEKPDVMIIFSDPHRFDWVFSNIEKINKTCPIIYWHVWDSGPAPHYLKTLYNLFQGINCISKKTFDMLGEIGVGNIRYVPHGFDSNIFYKMEKCDANAFKTVLLGAERFQKNTFVCTWVNRNMPRKRPGDVLRIWALFLKQLKVIDKNADAILIMHTNPDKYNTEASDLKTIAEYLLGLEIGRDVFFPPQTNAPFEYMNALYNISDVCINIAYNEGFGLSTIEAMSTGCPIIVNETGGLIEQVDQNQSNGISIPPCARILDGVLAPYIFKDLCNCDDVVRALLKIYKDKKTTYSENALKFVSKRYALSKMIHRWDNSLEHVLREYTRRKE